MSSIEQIPDIVVTEGERAWCIEYQCSVIPTEEISGADGTSGRGWHVCRLDFRENYESQHKLTDTFSYLMKYHPQLGNFLIFFVNGEMIFHTQIKVKPRSQQMTFQVVRVPLLSFSWKKWRKMVEDSVPVKAHLKPVNAIEWTQETRCSLKISLATDESVSSEVISLPADA